MEHTEESPQCARRVFFGRTKNQNTHVLSFISAHIIIINLFCHTFTLNCRYIGLSCNGRSPVQLVGGL